jgi:ankyrin repeat protein
VRITHTACTSIPLTSNVSFISDSPTLAPGVAPDEKQKASAAVGPGSVASTLADDMAAGEGLLAAVVNGDMGSVKALVSHGVASTCRNSLMATPLAVACEAGHRDMVQLLVDVSRSSVRTFDVNLRRPLHLAALSKSREIVELLVAAGANVHDTDVNGNTALHYATLCDAIGCVQVLLQAGSQVSAQNKDGSTALHLLKGFAAAKLLLDDGRNKDAMKILDSRGRNVLHCAALCGGAELLGLLLHFNITFGSPLSLLDTDDQGSSVLHNACKPNFGNEVDKDAENMTIQILKHMDEGMQAELSNLTDVNHMTALHLACMHGQLNSCKALLLAGADPMPLDKDGMMPLTYACLHSHRRVGDYIMSMMSRPELPVIPDNEGVSVTSKRHSSELGDNRDSSSRTSCDAAQELGDDDESPKRKSLSFIQQESQWIEGSGPEAIAICILRAFSVVV